MIKKLLTAAAVCAALSSGAAQATTFDFSYTFTDGQELTGSFSGTTANGGLSATNISNLQVAFAGTAFTGGVSPTLVLNSWNSSSTSPGWNSASVPTTIYANGSLNNFVFPTSMPRRTPRRITNSLRQRCNQRDLPSNCRQFYDGSVAQPRAIRDAPGNARRLDAERSCGAGPDSRGAPAAGSLASVPGFPRLPSSPRRPPDRSKLIRALILET
jgi:hypothetical protein